MKKLFAVLLSLFSSCSFAQCVFPQQDGTQIFTADTPELCNGYWLIPASEYSTYLTAVEITTADIGSAFMWGFGTVVTLAFLSWKVRLATSLIRKM